ncbi:alpha/beta fold hydrolase [Rhodohalobacter sp. SW132]|uniref:alpha/beta fold hydrolase n=1 Tax=Rhodohalobacter sp. SW132 TaxID=2293433 RepID=UPI001314C856|nr:alpha/beta hydrolase [Rhodohalobacter sp. SW132]
MRYSIKNNTIINSTIILITLLIFSDYPLNAQESHKVITPDGAEIYYRVCGEGPPLLLVHGFLATGELWEPFLDDLASSYTVIVPDMRGHGRSSNPDDTFIHKKSGGDMLAVLDDLGIEEVQAVGFSSGAMSLIHAATLQQDRFKSLVLLGGTTHFPETSRAIQRNVRLEGFPPEVLTLLRRWHPGNDEQIRELSANFRDVAANYRDMNFTEPLMGTISAETLIVHGDRDEHFPMEIAVRMYRAIPDAYLWIVPNGNHGLLFEGWGGSFPGSGEFIHVMQEFLSGEWSQQ